ncbi:MAG: hypothetical protein K0R54_884 [Clostridiaceae bacterium]|nr:hypothetical protein [Clostridiaceae bacterium]
MNNLLETSNVVAIIGAFLAVFFILIIIFYVFYSLSLYQMASRRGIENAWLSWIPVGNYFILGMIGKENSKFKNFEYIMLGLAVLEFLCSIIIGSSSGISRFVSVVTLLFTFYALFIIYKSYSQYFIVLTILTIITLGLLSPFFLFAIRNNPYKLFNGTENTTE